MSQKGINKVILIGNLGREPETKHFSNGGSVCNCAVATCSGKLILATH